MLEEMLIYVDCGKYYLSYSCPVLSCGRCKLRFLCYTSRERRIKNISALTVDRSHFSKQQHFRPRWYPNRRLLKPTY